MQHTQFGTSMPIYRREESIRSFNRTPLCRSGSSERDARRRRLTQALGRRETHGDSCNASDSIWLNRWRCCRLPNNCLRPAAFFCSQLGSETCREFRCRWGTSCAFACCVSLIRDWWQRRRRIFICVAWDLWCARWHRSGYACSSCRRSRILCGVFRTRRSVCCALGLWAHCNLTTRSSGRLRVGCGKLEVIAAAAA